ncbi:hypothetical protein AB6A40_003988 [Gnathostoma spinigerum]|uniref:EF-hand domain-containing protein n=1 Tax=Gnathostoma spinigerum TaxID=75299 RepID=A0ABD6EB53_9BILA
MWRSALNGPEPDWQRYYIDLIFTLFDTSGDGLIDLAEYIQVLSIFDISQTEAISSFDKFAKKDDGTNIMAINYNQFCSLWHDYFHSTDMNAPGNYLFGYIS